MAAVPSIGRAFLVEAPRRAPQAAATEGLYERHAAKILAYCHHQLGSREEAEDAVQTTFMNAFRALGRGVVPEAESAWLFKIAENVCLSRRRSSWRRGRIESPSDFEVIEEIVPGPSRLRDELIGIEDALASMPEQQRRAILLREWQGLSYREIAEELEVSQSAVETLIFRARRSLAQGLEQPDTIKPKRKSFRRALHMVDVGTVLAALKTLLAGSAAVKATAAAVAVTAAAGTAATVNHELESMRSAPKAAVTSVAPVAEAAPVQLAAAERATPAYAVAPASKGSAPAKAAEKTFVTAPKAAKAPKPVAIAPKTASPTVATTAPLAAEPAPAPVAEPTPAPVAEQPKHEAKQEEPKAHPAPQQPAEPAKTNEGKKEHGDKGRSTEPAPAPAQPTEKAKGKGNAKHVEPVVVETPLPSSVTAPAALTVDPSGKKDKGNGNGHVKREPAAVVMSEPAPAPVAEPTPVVETAPVAEPAAAEPAPAKSEGKGHGKAKGK